MLHQLAMIQNLFLYNSKYAVRLDSQQNDQKSPEIQLIYSFELN